MRWIKFHRKPQSRYLIDDKFVPAVFKRGAISSHEPDEGHTKGLLRLVPGWKDAQERKLYLTWRQDHTCFIQTRHSHSQSWEDLCRNITLRWQRHTSSMGIVTLEGGEEKVRGIRGVGVWIQDYRYGGNAICREICMSSTFSIFQRRLIHCMELQ